MRVKIIANRFVYWGTVYALKRDNGKVVVRVGDIDGPTDSIELKEKDFNGGDHGQAG